MKIVNRAKLKQMPPGTLYASYQPCVSGDLYVKYDTCGNDWVLLSLDPVSLVESDSSDQLMDRLDDMQLNGAEYPASADGTDRDATYESDDKLYIVFDKNDVRTLIGILEGCL